MKLIEVILSKENLNKVCKKVVGKDKLDIGKGSHIHFDVMSLSEEITMLRKCIRDCC